jgi:hypothetical protein
MRSTSTALAERPPHPALRASFSHGGEKESRLQSIGSMAFSPPWEKVGEARMRGAIGSALASSLAGRS